MSGGFPESLAIAGAWGYIGQKFLSAGQTLGQKLYVYDPGPAPADVNWNGVTRLDDPTQFYELPADLFHLAVHPDQRRAGLEQLLRRSRAEPIFVLCEKPMAQPEHPEHCEELLRATSNSGVVLLYDFPELYDPLFDRILKYLDGFQSVQIETLEVQRSKDREDPAIPRNRKLMLPIQYQESVHCLAFVLFLLAHMRRGRTQSGSRIEERNSGLPSGETERSSPVGSPPLAAVFRDGLTVQATSLPYRPPNPEDYRYVVDGRCGYELQIGGVAVRGLTDFRRGAPWAKRRVIRGTADGRPFVIQADFLEGQKRLVLDGEAQASVTGTDSYAEVLKACGHWYRTISRAALMQGLYPNPAFARVTYQLSSILWRSSRDHSTLRFGGLQDVLDFDAQFAAELPSLMRR